VSIRPLSPWERTVPKILLGILTLLIRKNKVQLDFNCIAMLCSEPILSSSMLSYVKFTKRESDKSVLYSDSACAMLAG
jgi:hypothetical protein